MDVSSIRGVLELNATGAGVADLVRKPLDQDTNPDYFWD
jgi:hypothetical protein